MKKGYENDIDVLHPLLVKLPFYVACGAFAVAVLLIIMLLRFPNSTSLAFGFYLIDAITWSLMAIFFYFLYVRFYQDIRNVMELKIISLLAGIASLAQFALKIINIFSFGSPIYSLEQIVETIVWLLLTIFFFAYWWRMHDYDFDGRIEDVDYDN